MNQFEFLYLLSLNIKKTYSYQLTLILLMRNIAEKLVLLVNAFNNYILRRYKMNRVLERLWTKKMHQIGKHSYARQTISHNWHFIPFIFYSWKDKFFNFTFHYVRHMSLIMVSNLEKKDCWRTLDAFSWLQFSTKYKPTNRFVS